MGIETGSTRDFAAVAAAESRKVYGAYMAAQAVLGVVLWVLIATSSTVRSWFELAPERREVTDAFFVADMVVVVGSALSAWALLGERSWVLAALGFTAGGVVYPTVYLASWVVATEGDGLVALGLMLAVSAVTCWVLYDTWRFSRR